MNQLAEELAQIKTILKNHPRGMSITEIASELGRNNHSVGRYLDILHASGYVDLRTFGMAKVYTLSSRVPLSAMLSYTTDLVVVLDRDLRIVHINEPFLHLVGLNKDEVLFQYLNHLKAPDPAVHDLIRELNDHVFSSRDDLELTLNTEPARYLRLKVVPTVFDDGGAGTTLVLEDVTVEKEALRSVQESEVFFRSVAERISDGLVISEGKEILFVNDRMSEILGYSREELLQLQPYDIVAPEELNHFDEASPDADKGISYVHDAKFWAVRKDGEYRYLYARLSHADFNNAVRSYILITDMTEWKKQEEARFIQMNLMNRLMNSFHHPIYVLDQNGFFVNANSAFCDLIHKKQDQVIGKNFRDAIPADFQDSFSEGDTDLFEKQDHIQKRGEFFRSDGTGIVLFEKSSVTAGPDGGACILGVIIEEI